MGLWLGSGSLQQALQGCFTQRSRGVCPERRAWVLGPDRDHPWSSSRCIHHPLDDCQASRLPGQVTQPLVGLSRTGTKLSLFGFLRVPFPVVNLEKGVREISECKETWGRWPLA